MHHGRNQARFPRLIEASKEEQEMDRAVNPRHQTRIIEIGKEKTTTGGVINRVPVQDIILGIGEDKWEITGLGEDIGKSGERTWPHQVERILWGDSR